MSLRLPDDLRERVERAATQTKKRSPQEVIEEVLSLYLDVYVSANLSIRGAIQKQSVAILSNIGSLEPAEAVLIREVENLNELTEENKPERKNKRA